MLLEQLQASVGKAYTIERELGGGGMSKVFLATENRLNRKVVIKVLSPDLAQGVSADRFEREIQLAAQLQQANIVPLLATGDTNGLPYFTMPFVEGESLRARLTEVKSLPISECVSILRDVARALSYAHTAGVVHRDIKPDNVLLSHGAAVVTDFGIAKALSASRQHTGDSELTQTGTSIGSPAYMAPEQIAGDPNIDYRADLYALGCMAYEMVAGQPPFTAQSPQRVLAAHLAEKPRPIRELRADVPPGLAAIIMLCLEKDPDNRPANAEEIIRALDTTGTTASGGLRYPQSEAPRNNRYVIGALAVVALGGAIAFLATRGHSNTSASPDAISLAVLPIENVGGDSSREYLADGMTGELANALRKTPGLVVAGDLSTFRFKHKNTNASEISRELGVQRLLTGRLQSQGEHIRLQMQLSDADGKLVWSNTFDRESKDNFALQDQITAAVANEMRLVLSPLTLARSRAGRTENPAAHDLYLRGVFEKNKLSEQGLERGLTYFQKALELDSTYAQAHEGMAFVYDLEADAFKPSHEYHLLARREAERAVRSDSLLAEGRVLNGFEIAASEWDFPAGLAEMRRGIALNPNSPDALLMYSLFNSISGNTNEGLRTADQLIRVDPLSATASLARTVAFFFNGRFAEALKQDSVTKKLDPSVVYYEAMDAASLRELGRYPEAVAAYKDFEKITGQPSFGLAMTYGRMGKHAEATAIMRDLEELARHQWIDPTLVLAVAYSDLGDKDRAMEWLEKSYAMKAFSLRFTLSHDSWMLRGLRDDPRFIALRRRVLSTTFKD